MALSTTLWESDGLFSSSVSAGEKGFVETDVNSWLGEAACSNFGWGEWAVDVSDDRLVVFDDASFLTVSGKYNTRSKMIIYFQYEYKYPNYMFTYWKFVN